MKSKISSISLLSILMLSVSSQVFAETTEVNMKLEDASKGAFCRALKREGQYAENEKFATQLMFNVIATIVGGTGIAIYAPQPRSDGAEMALVGSSILAAFSGYNTILLGAIGITKAIYDLFCSKDTPCAGCTINSSKNW